MQTRRRKFVVLLAVGAMAWANCFGVEGAIAAHHPDSSAAEQTVDHRPHDHASGHHDGDSAGSDSGTAHGGKHSGVGDSSTICCTSMTCTAAAVFTPGNISPMRADTNPVTAVLDDAVRTVSLGTIDPPPRPV